MKKLMPNPLDGKNLTRDWIEEIFEDYDCLYNGRDTYTGFVKNAVCCCEVSYNTIFWKIIDFDSSDLHSKEAYDELIKRLNKHSKYLGVSEMTLFERDFSILQNFFYEDED